MLFCAVSFSFNFRLINVKSLFMIIGLCHILPHLQILNLIRVCLLACFCVQEICRQPTTASRLTHKTQLAMAAADSAGCHRDAILVLASVNLSSHRLISGSRDGAVKVWK